MRESIITAVLAGLLLCPLATRDASAADAQVRYVITNGGIDVKDAGEAHFSPAGHHDQSVDWSRSGNPTTLPDGTYDVHITFADGAATKDVWIDGQTFAGKVERTVEIGLPITEVRYVITNGGADVKDKGEVHYTPPGQRDQVVTWARSGGSVRMPEGHYDVHVTFSDGAAEKDTWISDQAFSGKVDKTFEAGLSLTEVRYIITNGGADVKDKGQVHLSRAGHHDQSVTWAGSGDPMRIPEGHYDVHVTFGDGAAHKDMWIDDQAFSGKVAKTVEIGLPLTDVRYVITNGGADVKGKGQVHVAPAGHHDQVFTWASSGETMRIPEGRYDVRMTFIDGSAHKEIWFDGQAFAGKVEKTVEVGTAMTDVRYVITNGGEDTKDKGQAHYAPAGHHDQEITWAGSGDAVRLPEGKYDVRVTFNDGTARKEMWIDAQAFSGKVEKTVEVGLPVADVRYLLTNDGADVKDKGQIHYAPAGHHDQEIVWTRSGETVRLAQGAYDVRVTYDDGLIHKRIWTDNQAFSGKVDRTVELALKFAEPAVSVTRDGADVGDQASVGFVDPGRHEEIGAVRSGEQTILEAGIYDIRASLFGAEGWLRGVALAGKQHLTIELKPVKTEQLQAKGPPPKACVIEVYGVNFDFDKSVLRPDSDPVLKQILALFTGTPSFAAEIGGHTDNVGTPDYNLKLSDARAAAVKTWLTAHGVAAARVTSHGYGDTRPLVPNTTDENRFKNRRVELRTAECR